MIRWCWGGNRENRSPGGDGIGGGRFRFIDTYPMGIELEGGIWETDENASLDKQCFAICVSVQLEMEAMLLLMAAGSIRAGSGTTEDTIRGKKWHWLIKQAVLDASVNIKCTECLSVSCNNPQRQKRQHSENKTSDKQKHFRHSNEFVHFLSEI